MRPALALLFSLLLSTISHAGPHAGYNEDFEALKNSGIDFSVTGTICEEVARLQLAREYRAPQYEVVTGIAYGDNHRTIGELDVIVFEGKTKEVVKLAEVKCWKNMEGGLRKAHEQRSRFQNAVRHMKHLFFRSTKDGRQYSQDQFDEVRDFDSIAQEGSASVGYDIEIPYSLSEVMDLRSKLMDCQNRGACKRP